MKETKKGVNKFLVLNFCVDTGGRGKTANSGNVAFGVPLEVMYNHSVYIIILLLLKNFTNICCKTVFYN